MQELKFPKGFDENAVLTQVNNEYMSSKDFVETKRQLFKDRYDLYMNIADQKNKIYVRLIRSVMETLLSLYYQDKIKVNFTARHFEDSMQATNLQNLAEFDYEEMGLAEKKYQVQWDKFFYGVGIEMYDGWDSVSKKPKTRVVDPRTWVPSQYDVNYGYKFHGFEMNIAGFELNNPRFLNTDKLRTKSQIDKIREALHSQQSFTEAEFEAQMNSSRKLGNDSTYTVPGNETYSIYYHYTVIGGDKYLVILGNEKSLVLAVEKLVAVRAEEKLDSNKIPFPVIIRHYSPLRGDPYGVSIPDILEDKQRMQQLFMNLNRIKAEHEARGDFFLYDPDAVQNINALKIPSTGPKYIKANLSMNPNPITSTPKPQITQDAYNMPNVVGQQGQLDVGLDTRSLGISGGTSITATENIRVQKNANLKLVLGSRIDNRAEKAFWDILRYRVYQQFFKYTDKKNIYINQGSGRLPLTVNKKDFVSKYDVDIRISTQSEEDEQKEKERAGFNMMFNVILQNPTSSAFAKNEATKHLLELNGTPKEAANVYIGESIDEMLAKQDLELLNRNEEPLTPTVDQDHMTFIQIYQQALNTDAKYKAIAMRQELFIKSGQQAKVMEQQQGMATSNKEDLGNTQSQLTSNAIQKENKQEQTSLAI